LESRTTPSEPLEFRESRAPARFPWWGAAGVLIFSAGLVAIVRDVPVANALWYLPAWYGYLLFADACLFRMQGRSFVGSWRRELASMMFWSIPFWFFFEAFNLRLLNWSYVFTLRRPVLQAVDSALAFATVLPACLLHAELAGALGWWQRARTASRPLGPGAPEACLAGGIACAAASLLWPKIAYPLVWFVPLGIAEWACYRLGAPSLLRDAEHGRWSRIARLAAGGLWAGIVWELFNWKARTKWIYTTPGFDRPKLFEMPWAGYGGFPILALSAFSFFSLVAVIRIRAGDGAGRRARYAVACAAAVLFSAATLVAVVRRTCISQRPLLEELTALDAPAIAKLRAAGLPTPERLERAARAGGVAAISARTGIPARVLAPAAAEASLAVHKGMGVAFARLLERTGVGGVADLSRRDPDALARRVARVARSDERVPRREIVRVWVRDARSDGVPSR
jgi:hypothetical protein